MVDLNSLKDEISSIGNKIKELKNMAVKELTVTDEIGKNVQDLLAKKQLYAEHNNGIGIDGKPFAKNMTKAEKKKQAQAQKQQQQNQQQQNQEQSQAPKAENASKKAAKKAEKAAKKAAYKAGGGAPAAGSGGGGGAPPPQQQQQGKKQQPPPQLAQKKAVPPPTMKRGGGFQVKPLQMVINPNAPIEDRPVVALAMAVLTNTDIDLELTSDHRIAQATLGGEAEAGDETPQIVGDLSMARYLVARSDKNEFASVSNSQQALQNAWIDYASSLKPLSKEQALKGIGMTLGHALFTKTYLVGESLTFADVALFGAMAWPSQSSDLAAVTAALQANDYTAALRWTTMMASHPAIRKATQLAMGVNGTTEVGGDLLEPLVSGMNLLEGAVPGNVVTRFPPEPSGYLHIGHAKAVLLNDYYARRYKGRLIVRFDDTNPSKEKEEYQQSIVEDLKLLGVDPDVVTYTSDYFKAIFGYALSMIENGTAYMDDTPQEQMKLERADRVESKHRNMPPEEAKEKFLMMNSGKEEGAAWCLRAKIDMNSDNGTLRDPVLFRQNLEPHHRSGTTYKAYPTYDLACPIVDSLEGVTHALRTTEYNDRDEQYQWIQTTLGLRRVRIHSFSRVNFMYTVLSKRKLAWFVEQGLVEGWGDARFPTVRGVVRRGVNLDALKTFIYSQGASRRVVNMDWSKFWAENKKEIDKQAKRFMAIDANTNVPLKVTNGPAIDSNSYLSTANHPKDPSLGSRALRIGQDVILETVDVEGIQEGEEIVLLRWGVVKITKVTQANGNVGSLEGEFIPDGDYKTAKRKLSWMIQTGSNPIVELTEFDHLVTKDKLEEEDNFADYVNPTTLATTQVMGDAGLKTLQEHEIIQLERRGFFRVDRPYRDGKPLILYMIPDGKTKSMSGMTGKLAHH